VGIGILGAVAGIVPGFGTFLGDVVSGKFDQAIGALGTLGARIQVGSSLIVVNGANDGPPEAIMLTSQYDNSDVRKIRILDLNLRASKVLWQSPDLDQKLYSTPILADASRVYFMSGRQLTALNRSDGSAAWQASMADVVQLNLCPNCLLLAGQ